MSMFIEVLSIMLLLFVMIVAISFIGKKYRFLTPILFSVIFLTGFVIYGICFLQVYHGDVIAGAIHAAISTLKMFVGANGYGDIKEASFIADSIIVRRLFWGIHFVAFAITAKTILDTIGKKVYQKIKTFLSRKGDLIIIYGLNEESIAFGEELHSEKDFSVVYIDDSVDSSYAEAVKEKISGLLVTDMDAVYLSKSFLRQIGIDKSGRKLLVYALGNNELGNVNFVKKLNQVLKDNKIIKKENVLLTLIANMDMDYGRMFQATKNDEYGFGSVLIVDRPYLVSKTLINNYPPADYIDFDHDSCIAREDFDAVIIGFDDIGQAVFKNIAMNACFYGSKLNITVYDPNYRGKMGCMRAIEPGLFENTNVRFVDKSARSIDFYEQIASDPGIEYIAVCISDTQKNRSITDELQTFFSRNKSKAKVFQCSNEGVDYYDWENCAVEKHRVFIRDNLDIIRFDKKAMKLNYIYCRTNEDDKSKTPLDYWIEASFNNKMSSRASANYSKSYLRIIGRSEEEILSELEESGHINLTDEQLENLAKTEHLRWMAYTYSAGYTQMSMDIFCERGEAYRQEVSTTGSSKLKIQIDNDRRLHACLIPWDELDELSTKFTEYTGKPKDYKQDDRNNVLMFPELLR